MDLQEFKSWAYVEHDEDDALIEGIILPGAIAAAEGYLGRQLQLTTDWKTQTVEANEFNDGEQISGSLPEGYHMRGVRGWKESTQAWEELEVACNRNGGLGWASSAGQWWWLGNAEFDKYQLRLEKPARIEPDIKIAILFLAAHYYENRSAVVVGNGITSAELPLAVKSILLKYRQNWH